MISISRPPSPKAHLEDTHLIASVLAITLSNIVKQHKVGDLRQLCLSCISASFLLAISSYGGKKRSLNDRVLVFFSDSDKKSIVTLYESQIHRIHITAAVEGTGGEGHSMVAILDKVVIGQGKKCKAERKIDIQSYTHAWEKTKNGLGKPQVTLVISGKDCRKQIETCFSHLENKKSFTLVMKTKKYVERAHIPCEWSDAFVEKAITLTIDRRSILVKLLELYTRENSADNTEKAIYLAGRFIHFLPKTILEHLRKRVKKSCTHTSETSGPQRLMDALNPLYIPSSNAISSEQMISLESDIMTFIKERACRYENLHEALSQDVYARLVSPGIEEIIACYSTKANHPTNSLLKRCISEDKTLAERMKIIHGFIDACKKHSNAKLETIILDSKLLQNFQGDDSAMYAYESLRSRFTDCKAGEGFFIRDVIESARQKVALKYSTIFISDIVGIAVKTAVSVDEMHVKTEKVKDPDELLSCFTIREEGTHVSKHSITR